MHGFFDKGALVAAGRARSAKGREGAPDTLAIWGVFSCASPGPFKSGLLVLALGPLRATIESRKESKAAKQHSTSALGDRCRHEKEPRAGYALGALYRCLSLYALRAASGCRGMGDAVRIEAT